MSKLTKVPVELLSCVAQLISTVKIEWEQQGAWSAWDQSVLDGVLAGLREASAESLGGGYEIQQAGSIWKVYGHGTWFANCNTRDDAVALVRGRLALSKEEGGAS